MTTEITINAPANSLVTISVSTGEPVTNTRIIAEGTGIQHDSITRLIRKHRGEFEEFGLVGFEIQLIEGGKRASSKVWFLNEDQATYLLTLLDNNDTVRAFKRRLVHAYRASKEELLRLQAQGPQHRVSLPDSKDHARMLVTEAIQAMQESLRLKRSTVMDAGGNPKLTLDYHYSNEIGLCKEAAFGKWDDGKLKLNGYTLEELELFRLVIIHNTKLISQRTHGNKSRKPYLIKAAAEIRQGIKPKVPPVILLLVDDSKATPKKKRYSIDDDEGTTLDDSMDF